MGLALQGQWPLLGETPHGHRSVDKGQSQSHGGSVLGKNDPSRKGSNVPQHGTSASSPKCLSQCPSPGREPIPTAKGDSGKIPGRYSRGHPPRPLLPIICARHHVLLIDELDTVNGAPGRVAVRDPPYGQHPTPHILAGRCLTGGHRRPAVTPQVSSTRARFHHGPLQSHSTPCSGHPTPPLSPGVQSWKGAEGGAGSPETNTSQPAPPRHTLTVSPRMSSLPHSTPSLSGHEMCCRAGGCLCGMPAPEGGERQRGPRQQEAQQKAD